MNTKGWTLNGWRKTYVGGRHHWGNHVQVNLALILFFYEKFHEEMLCEPVTNINMVSICHLEKCFWKLSLTYMHCRWNYLVDQATLLAWLHLCVCVCVCACVRVCVCVCLCVCKIWKNKKRSWLDGLIHFSYQHFLKLFENILTCFFSESLRKGCTSTKDFAISKNSPLVGFLLNEGKYAREVISKTVARIKLSWSSFGIFPFLTDNFTSASL